MEELREMVKRIGESSTDELVEMVPKMMDLVKEVGFLKMVQDDDLKSLIPDLREKMGDIEVDKLLPLAGVVLPAIFGGLSELIEGSEEAKEQVADMEDMKVQLAVPDLDVYLYVTLLGGKFAAGTGKIDDAELTLTMDKTSFIETMQGKGNLVNSYLAGNVSLEGPVNKAMALNGLLEVISDEYDLELGLG